MVTLHEQDFDPWALIQAHQNTLRGYGAMASFVGSMRDFNEGDTVTAMHLEHYPGMTQAQLEEIVQDGMQRWSLLGCRVAHRVGDITPEQPIVLTACWSAHRKEAFEACRYLMEALKSRAPFWKREQLIDGTQRWVEKNTPGY